MVSLGFHVNHGFLLNSSKSGVFVTGSWRIIGGEKQKQRVTFGLCSQPQGEIAVLFLLDVMRIYFNLRSYVRFVWFLSICRNFGNALKVLSNSML